MKTIVWDVDDVLNDLMRAWLEESLSNREFAVFPYQRLTRNPPHELLGIGLQKYLASLDAFRLSGRAANLAPSPEILDWFSTHGDKCHNVALTAAPLCAGHISAEWVMRHFGRWIRSFNLVPSQRARNQAGQDRLKTKGDFLRWWGKADMLVDDNEENLAAALSLNIHAALVPQPWNSSRLSLTDTLQTITEFVG